MTFPDDLPLVVVYRLGSYPDRDRKLAPITKCTYPRRPVVSISTSGNTDAAMICPRIPHGCTGWRLLTDAEDDWKPVEALPPHWLPFLNRERGTFMDFRSPPCPNCGEDTATRGRLCARCQRKLDLATQSGRGTDAAKTSQ